MCITWDLKRDLQLSPVFQRLYDTQEGKIHCSRGFSRHCSRLPAHCGSQALDQGCGRAGLVHGQRELLLSAWPLALYPRVSNRDTPGSTASSSRSQDYTTSLSSSDSHTLLITAHYSVQLLWTLITSLLEFLFHSDQKPFPQAWGSRSSEAACLVLIYSAESALLDLCLCSLPESDFCLCRSPG